MKKELPLGQQEFSEVIKNNCIYVDKTEAIYHLANTSKYYFLSRPRRFGKSLLVNTVNEIFNGNKELFKGLWIYDKWNWKETYPVIKISFANIDYDTFTLKQAISDELNDIAKEKNIKLTKSSPSRQFKELIHKLSENGQVVILIDEYDKPIIDYMTNIPQAEENRDVLKKFYSVIKDADKYIKFLLITGVSKFSHVSIFSDLNNLTDITIDPRFSTITGFTKQELEDNFSDYIEGIKQKFANIPDIMQIVREWYNGYSWDGVHKVYNPVSIMNFFAKKQFLNYWFSTGTPTMLMKIIKKQNFTAFDIENVDYNTDILNKYDFTNIDLISLLFQTGYLTIGKMNDLSGRIKLVYPNKEVAQSFSSNVLAELSDNQEGRTHSMIFKITDNLADNNIDKFITHINQLFKNIPYSIVENKENYFHSLFYLVVKLLGYQIEINAEILTIDGRIDAVLETDNNIYIIEFKINQSAEVAIQQIKDKKYHDKYKSDNKPITLLGINFDTEKRRIDDYLIEN